MEQSKNDLETEKVFEVDHEPVSEAESCYGTSSYEIPMPPFSFSWSDAERNSYVS